MNIDKLLEVRASILAHPEHFDMGDFFQAKGVDSEYEEDIASLDITEYVANLDDFSPTNCGTSACIAGWTVALNPTLLTPVDLFWDTTAARILGLTARQAQELFFAHEDFEPGTFIASRVIPLGRIQVPDAIQAIDSLIKTGSATWPDHLLRTDISPSWWIGTNRERWTEHDASLAAV